MPPEKPRRRWFAYSLRALFLLVTVLCVWLGVHVSRRLRYEAACARLSEFGMITYYVNDTRAHGIGSSILHFAQAPPEPSWLRMLVGDEWFGEDLSVDLTQQNINESFTRPRHQCTDNDLRLVRDLPNVTYVEAMSPEVTDQGLRYLADVRKLSKARLHCSGITDEGLRHLESLKNLREILLLDTQVTPAGVARLKRAIPGLSVRACTFAEYFRSNHSDADSSD